MSVEFNFLNKTSPHLVNSGVALSLRLFGDFRLSGENTLVEFKMNLHKSNAFGPPHG